MHALAGNCIPIYTSGNSAETRWGLVGLLDAAASGHQGQFRRAVRLDDPTLTVRATIDAVEWLLPLVGFGGKDVQ